MQLKYHCPFLYELRSEAGCVGTTRSVSAEASLVAPPRDDKKVCNLNTTVPSSTSYAPRPDASGQLAASRRKLRSLLHPATIKKYAT